MTETYDLAIVGSGIVGLAHAWHAARAGMRVLVIERDERPVGASIRNFGHLCITAQAGVALDYARAAREYWLAAGAAAGFPVATDGTVVLARTAAELAVLEEFTASRPGVARMLDPRSAATLAGFDAPGVLGGVHLPDDLRVDSPTAIPALVRALAALGVEFHFGENVLQVTGDGVSTTRGDYRADTVVLAVGHDVDRFLPDLAQTAGLRRCRLRMLEVDAPRDIRVAPGVFTGTSLLRYDGFAGTNAAARLRAELAETDPALLDNVVNLMLTQRPNGRLVIGDTHHYALTHTPFDDDELDELLLDRFRALLGADRLHVRRRWRGVYASAPAPFLVAQPQPGVIVASVTTGIGMTTGFGFARSVLEEQAALRPALATL